MRTAAGPTLLLAQGRLEEGLASLMHRKYDVGEPRRDAEVSKSEGQACYDSRDSNPGPRSYPGPRE